MSSQDGPPIETLSPQAAREFLVNAQKANVSKLPTDCEERALPCGPSGQLSVRIVRPKGLRETLPVIVYIHGGGWVLGSYETHERLVRELAVGCRAAVVFVNYTPSPEAEYPTAIEECYAATQYVSENAASLNLDASRLAVAGDSVGGNMATVACILAKQRGGPAIRMQVLFYPVTNANFDTHSYHQFANGYYLTRSGMKWFWDMYCPNRNARREITASPLQALPEQLAGLPRAVLITGECDVLRDEGEAYAHKLLAARVPVKAIRCLAIVHDFVMLGALRTSAAAQVALDVAIGELNRELGEQAARKAA